MERLLFLILSLVFLTFLISVTVGDVRELFNHPELEHRRTRDEKSNPNYDNVEKAMDDLYTSLEDYDVNKKKLYNFEKPEFEKQLVNALSRIKYVNNDLNKDEQKRVIPDTNNIDYLSKINSLNYNRPNEKEKEQNFDVKVSNKAVKKLRTNVNDHKISNNFRNKHKRLNSKLFHPNKKCFTSDKIDNPLDINDNSDNNIFNIENKFDYNLKNEGLIHKNRPVNKHDEGVIKKSNDVSDKELLENYVINCKQNNKSSRYYNDLNDGLLFNNKEFNRNRDSIIDRPALENDLINTDNQNNKSKCKNYKDNVFMNKNGDSIMVESKDFFNQEALEDNGKNSDNQNNMSNYRDNILSRKNVNINKNIGSVVEKADELSDNVGIESILISSDQNNKSKYDNYNDEFSDTINHGLNKNGNAVDEKSYHYSNHESDFKSVVNTDGVLHASLKKIPKLHKKKLSSKKLEHIKNGKNVLKINTDNDHINNEDDNSFVVIDDINYQNNSSESSLTIKVSEEPSRGFKSNCSNEELFQFDRRDDALDGRTRIKRGPSNDLKLLNNALDSNNGIKVSNKPINGYYQISGDKFGKKSGDDKLNKQNNISPYLVDSSKNTLFPASLESTPLPTVLVKNRVSIIVKRLNNGIVSAPIGRCPFLLRVTAPSVPDTDPDSELLGPVVKLNRSGSTSDELRIAHDVSDFVANILFNAGRTGGMRKELGLCKTYDKRYPFHVNKQVDDHLLAGLMNCISSIMEESITNQKCSEMPSELKAFIDWLLLNGISARDEFKQFLSADGCQRKSFLFPPNEGKGFSEFSSMTEANQIVLSSTPSIRRRVDNYYNYRSPKSEDTLKKYIDNPSDIFGESNSFQHVVDKNPYALFKHYFGNRKISPIENNYQNLYQNPLLDDRIKYYSNNNNNDDDDANDWGSKNQIIDSLNMDNNGKYDNDISLVGSPNKNDVSNYDYGNRFEVDKKFKKESDDISEFETPIVYGNRNEQESS